jgi:hypothetical protein
MTALTENRASQHAPERATPARAAATPTARGYASGNDDYQRRLRKIRGLRPDQPPASRDVCSGSTMRRGIAW